MTTSSSTPTPTPESLMGEQFDYSVKHIREWSDRCAALTKERDDLRAAVVAAKELVDLLSAKISKAHYETVELEKIGAWEPVAGMMYDGTMASYADTFDAALNLTPS